MSTIKDSLIKFTWKLANSGKTVCVCVLVTQSCPTLCDPMDCSPPSSSVHGIFQARILERVTIAFSRGSSRPKGRTPISCVSCIGRQVLYHWATWDGIYLVYSLFPWLVEGVRGKLSLEDGEQHGWESFFIITHHFFSHIYCTCFNSFCSLEAKMLKT